MGWCPDLATTSPASPLHATGSGKKHQVSRWALLGEASPIQPHTPWSWDPQIFQSGGGGARELFEQPLLASPEASLSHWSCIFLEPAVRRCRQPCGSWPVVWVPCSQVCHSRCSCAHEAAWYVLPKMALLSGAMEKLGDSHGEPWLGSVASFRASCWRRTLGKAETLPRGTIVPSPGVIALQGVSPKAEQSPAPHTRHEHPPVMHNARLQGCAPKCWPVPSTTTDQSQHDHGPGAHRLP